MIIRFLTILFSCLCLLSGLSAAPRIPQERPYAVTFDNPRTPDPSRWLSNGNILYAEYKAPFVFEGTSRLIQVRAGQDGKYIWMRSRLTLMNADLFPRMSSGVGKIKNLPGHFTGRERLTYDILDADSGYGAVQLPELRLYLHLNGEVDSGVYIRLTPPRIVRSRLIFSGGLNRTPYLIAEVADAYRGFPDAYTEILRNNAVERSSATRLAVQDYPKAVRDELESSPAAKDARLLVYKLNIDELIRKRGFDFVIDNGLGVDAVRF